MKISNDAQAVIYRQDGKNIFFLLLYRHNPDKGIDEYRLVKGGIKQGESAEDAVKREAREEVRLKNVEVISKVHEYSYAAGDIRHIVHVFLIKTLDENIVVDSSEEGKFEIKGSKWQPVEKALNLLGFEDERKSIINSLQKIGSYTQ